MVRQYGILSIEDGMNSEDSRGWKLLMAELGSKVEIQGDDLFVTDAGEMMLGIDVGYAGPRVAERFEYSLPA